MAEKNRHRDLKLLTLFLTCSLCRLIVEVAGEVVKASIKFNIVLSIP